MKLRTNPAPAKECRQRPSRRLKQWVLEAQKHLCLGCNGKLDEVEYDHVIPLGLAGANSPDNWAALCPRCHRSKTRADLKRIAKAKRQRRFHETGRSRAPKLIQLPHLPSAKGFDRSRRRHINGEISTRCRCALCLQHNGPA
jgi:hypothetical protein